MQHSSLPPEMLSATRWMIKVGKKDDAHNKRPRAPFDQKPDDWPDLRDDGSEAHFPGSWDVPQAWGTYGQAVSYLDRHAYGQGLCFVTHSGAQREKVTRWVCIDIDDAFNESGALKKGVEDFLDGLPPTYVEVSMRGGGLHVIVMVEDCTLYRTVHRAAFFGAKADILFSGQFVVTGNTHPFYSSPEVAHLTEEEFLGLFPHITFRERAEIDTLHYDFPDQDLTEVPDRWKHLVAQMEATNCIEGQQGQKNLFKAACFLSRQGVSIQDAEPLLRCTNSKPAWSTRELRYILACSYRDTESKGESNTEGVYNEFDVYEEEPAQTEEPKKKRRYLFEPILADDLEAMDLKLEWIVEGLLVDKEPLMIGGREKTFKTSIAMDLAVSLSTGAPFLGRFNVKDKRSVLFFTGEIGPPACKNLVGRVRRAKHIEKGKIGPLTTVTTVPSFTNHRDKLSLEAYLKDNRPEVVIYDPLYFCMMGVEIGDMFQMGGYLREITELCKSYDAWPIFVHHARKDSSKEYQPMELGDLYGSGVSAFARQWILMSHSDPYRHGTAHLLANMGGSSTGDCGLWNLKIEEGKADEIADRRWGVSIGDEGPTECMEDRIVEALQIFGELNNKELAEMLGKTPKDMGQILWGIMKKEDKRILYQDKKVTLCA